MTRKIAPRVTVKPPTSPPNYGPQEIKAFNASTPGYLTTEFWLTLAVIVAALVLTLADKIGGEVGLGAITAAGGLYSVSRGLAKG